MLALTDRGNGNTAATLAPRLVRSEPVSETARIERVVMEHLEPKGAAVVIEAAHLCMKMHGIQKPNGVMVTSALRCVFKEDPSARAEVLALINNASRNCG